MHPIQQLVAQNRIEEALKQLLAITPEHQKKDVIALQTKWTQVKRNESFDLWSNDEVRREKARITMAILELIPKITGEMAANKEVSGRNIEDPQILPQKSRILFIAANPNGEQRLQTDVEHRKLIAQLRQGRARDKYEFLPAQFAVTPEELLRAFNDKPAIVHFSGHGSKEGLIITTEDNQPLTMPLNALKRLFKPLKGIAEIVVFNACWSSAQAREISEFGIYVVGNRLPIADQMAISFSKGFYNGLGEGKDFEGAFNDAMFIVETEHHASYSKATRDIGFQEQGEAGGSIIEVWKDGVKLDI